MVSFETRWQATCTVCGDRYELDSEEMKLQFIDKHKPCEELSEAMVKYLYLGPSSWFTKEDKARILNIYETAYKKYKIQGEPGVNEVDYDKFYR